jgi:hypothetical protein
MAHGFTDAQLTLRAAGGGVLLVVAGHCRNPNCLHHPPKRVIQYSASKTDFDDYWMPRLRGA